MFAIGVAACSTQAFALNISDCAAVSEKIRKFTAEKVKTGIPFELLAIVSQNNKPTCHSTLQVQLSMWDRKVKIAQSERLLARTTMDDFSLVICRNLVCQDNISSSGGGRLRVFLNPNWKGRLDRLKARTSGLNMLLYSLDWDDFSTEKNKDTLLFEEDLIP
jgi:hypothetical protein